MFTPGLIATLCYGLLSIGGGLMGYLKSRSTVSLISGSVSGVLLLALSGLIYLGFSWAEPIAAGIISVLVVVFIFRWFKTKKPIPALPMISCGIVSLAIILAY